MRILSVLSLFLLAATAARAQSFTLTISPKNQSISGARASYQVSVIPSGGFSATVFLKAGSPTLAGIFRFDVARLSAPYASTATLTVETSSQKDGTTHQIVVEGYDGTVDTFDTCTLTLPSRPAWRVFTYKNSPLPSMIVPTLSLVLDKAHRGWIGTGDRGIMMFDGINWSTYPTLGARVTPETADSSGGVWAAAHDDGINLLHFVDTTWSIVGPPAWSAADSALGIFLPESGATTSPDGTVWFNSRRGLVHVDGSMWSVVQLPTSSWEAPIIADLSGTIWVGGSNGTLMKYDGRFTSHYSGGDLGALSAYRMQPLAVDRSNSLWINLIFDGLATLSPGAASVRIRHATGSGLTSGDHPLTGPTCMAFGADGTMWIGHDGLDTITVGLYRTDGTNWWHYTRENSGLPDDDVLALAVDNATNTIWILTQRGLALLDGNAPPQTALSGMNEAIDPAAGSHMPAVPYPNPTTGAITFPISLDARGSGS